MLEDKCFERVLIDQGRCDPLLLGAQTLHICLGNKLGPGTVIDARP